MITRILTTEDFEQFAQVSACAYIHPAGETEFDESKTIFGAFIDEGKTLISQIESDLRGSIYCGQEILCTAAGGVASKPQYRRLGGVRAAFNALFEHSVKNNAVVSILYPFSIEYYRKFGYENIFKYFHLTCSFRVLEKTDRYFNLTLAEKKHTAEIIDVYRKVANKSNMMFARNSSDKFMLTPYENMTYTYFLNDGDSAGYACIVPKRETRTVTVRELLFTDAAALSKLLGFLRTYEGNYDTLIFDKLPSNTPVFNFLTDENKYIERKLCYNGAGRIINAEELLKANKYPTEKGSFSIKITDEQIAQNNGIFTVDYENGNCTVKKNVTETYDLSVDILAAARLLMGREGLTAEELSFIPGVQLESDCADFIRAFPRRATQFNDDF